MGYALLDAATDPPTIVDCGLVPVQASASPAERLLAIANSLDALIARHVPTALALERLYFNKNAKTAMRVAEARGVALLGAARAGLSEGQPDARVCDRRLHLHRALRAALLPGLDRPLHRRSCRRFD